MTSKSEGEERLNDSLEASDGGKARARICRSGNSQQARQILASKPQSANPSDSSRIDCDTDRIRCSEASPIHQSRTAKRGEVSISTVSSRLSFPVETSESTASLDANDHRRKRLSGDSSRQRGKRTLPFHGSPTIVGEPPGHGRLKPESHVTVVATYDGSSSAEELRSKSLVEPHQQADFHVIKCTFDRVKRRPPRSRRGNGGPVHSRPKKKPRTQSPVAPREREHAAANADGEASDEDLEGNLSSSGSGTEGGYAGSASSSDHAARNGLYSSGSSSESRSKKRREARRHVSSNSKPRRLVVNQKMEVPSSSEIADFSTTASDEGNISLAFQDEDDSPSITSSSNESEVEDDEQGEQRTSEWPHIAPQVPLHHTATRQLGRKRTSRQLPSGNLKSGDEYIDGKAPILALGCDVIAHVLTYLDPPTSLEVLTMPLSRDWMATFAHQTELWRVLCLLEPFKANVDEEDTDEEDSSPFSGINPRLFFGKYRLMYTGFVRCMRYLARIKYDAAHDRKPSVIDYADNSRYHNVGANQNLQEFLARARSAVVQRSKESKVLQGAPGKPGVAPIGVADDGSDTSQQQSKMPPKPKNRPAYGSSKLTQRLLGPSRDGSPGQTDLPWSCAIFSIVNWMVAFSNVEGIQIMCLKVLPLLLEDEQQRLAAQRASLTGVVLRAMVEFPESCVLHTAAFHTIVLLARPLGGREGMLFHTSMEQSSGIFDEGVAGGPAGNSGIAIMLESMRRFRSNEVLQAMSCWALVNIALSPAQKKVLVGLGGIEVTAKAMLLHPTNPEVQFRALFALINLVIPAGPEIADGVQNESSSRTPATQMLLDKMVGEIVRLVILAMRNFCSSEAVVNRACLVLHNLSLTSAYHEVLLLSPSCYQMLEWCLSNYPRDEVLQKSAAGTIGRLQVSLSTNDALRQRFDASQSNETQRQIFSLEQTHREAISIHEQERERQGLKDSNS